MDYLSYYGVQQTASVCEWCAGGHETFQCPNTYQPNNQYPNFTWGYNQGGMQQSQQPSYPYQNQQFDDWSYDPSEFQQQQFQYQPPEFQQQQFPTDFGQYSSEKSEIEELKLILESRAVTLKNLENQLGQIANALLNRPQGAPPSNIETDTAEQETELEAEQEEEQEAENEEENLQEQPHLPDVRTEILNLASSISEEKGIDTAVDETVQEQQKEQTEIYPPPPEFTMEVQDLIVTFNVSEAVKFPAEDEECCEVEVDDAVQRREPNQLLKSDPLANALQGGSDTENKEMEEHVQLFIAAPCQRRPKFPQELLVVVVLKDSQVCSKPFYEEAPKLELKPQTDHLRYAYLGESSISPVIINANLPGIGENKLLRVLREFKSAIEWTRAYIKEISPSYCMHKFLVEEGSNPSVEHHGMPYPIMKEVVEEEIIKWPMFGAHSTKAAGEKRMLKLKERLDKFRRQAHVHSKLYKECVKKRNDRQLAYKTLYPP